MLREGIIPELPLLAGWLSRDTSEQRVTAILHTISSRDANTIQPILTRTVKRQDLSEINRSVALSMLIDVLANNAEPLLKIAQTMDDGPLLAAVLREFGTRPKLNADDVLLEKLKSPSSVVRAEAIRSLGKRNSKPALDHVERLLKESDADVRLAAADAAGRLGATDAGDALLTFAAESDTALITASLDSLRRLNNKRAVSAATDALDHRETQSAAIEYLRAFGTPNHMKAVVQSAAQNPSTEFQQQVVQTFVAWQRRFAESHMDLQQAIAAVHGHSGQPLAWNVSGPLSQVTAKQLLERLQQPNGRDLNTLNEFSAATMIADGAPAGLNRKSPANANADSVWVAWTPVRVDDATSIEVLSSASGRLTLWLDGEQFHARAKSERFQPDSDRLPIELHEGTNWLVAMIRPDNSDALRFHLRFRRRSSKAEHERLIAYALKSRGDVNRGREVFAAADKSQCVRCHRLGTEGGRIGPDLTGIGSRFSRIHLVESMLDPGRSIAPSYSTMVVALKDGRVLTGVRVSESDLLLVLGDKEGKLHQLATSNIEEITTQAISTMPGGLEKKLTDREFADLLSFLESQKTSPVN